VKFDASAPLRPHPRPPLALGSGGANRGSRAFYPLAALLLALVPLGPLLHPEFLGGAAGATRTLARLLTLEAGGAWPLWSGADGPAAVVLAWLLGRAGVAPPDAIKLVMALATVGAAATMYRFASDLWGQRGGLLAAVLLVASPVRLVDLYVRGAVAESLAWLLPPLAFWAGRRALLARRPRTVAAAASLVGVVVVLLLLTHLGVALLALPALLLGWLWIVLTGRSEPRRCAPRAAQALAPIVLVAAGMVAALAVVARASSVPASDPAAFVVFPHQLLSPRWGVGTPAPGPDDSLSFEVGLAPAALTFAAVTLAFWQRAGRHPALRLSRRRRAALAFFAALAGGTVLLTLPPFLPLWALVPGAGALELPWRLLGVSALALAVAGGACGLLSFGRPAGQVALATVIGVAILAIVPYLQTPETVFRPPPDPPPVSAAR
jgi:hypothetical protein